MIAVDGRSHSEPVRSAVCSPPARTRLRRRADTGLDRLLTSAPTGPDTPASNPNATWSSVSCVSAVFCGGDGYYSGTSSDLPLLGVETDGTWTTQEAPLPANAAHGAPARLERHRCPRSARVMATGFYEDTGFT